MYASPVTIGREQEEDSTWFSGYHEKFFYDRGVLYRFLYGHLAGIWALRFLLAHRGKMCQQVPVREDYAERDFRRCGGLMPPEVAG